VTCHLSRLPFKLYHEINHLNGCYTTANLTMEINLNNAVSIFYPNPSYEQVYFEAVANALDAGADRVSIQIKIDKFEETNTLQLIIDDNGKGFTDENFKRFSKLLEVRSHDHKGLGRLVYLAYFKEVKIESYYETSKKREFTLNSKFNGKSKVKTEERSQGSILQFNGYHKNKVNSYAYLIPGKIKESLTKEFFPLFFRKKERGDGLHIEISLEVKEPNHAQSFVSGKTVLNFDDLPELEKATFKNLSLDFFQNFDIHYCIEKDISRERSISTSVCVDDRAIEYDLIPIESIPHGYQLRFLFISGFFEGKTNASRQRLELPDEMTERTLRTSLRREIGHIINEKIPSIESDNKQIELELNSHYPHLSGYFPVHDAGLIFKNDALEEAQKRFFSDQKKVLECENLNDEQYDKALELSSRVLAEYVMYRMRIISKLKAITPENDEEELHRLIVPMRKILREEEFDDDIYNNNVWILDDRFMSYNTILSDKVMAKVIKEISLDEIDDDGRPDITMIFSGNPEKEKKVSVVIVELKKKGLPLVKNEEVLTQLRKRAKKLLQYFPEKIERIWFYGITEIDSEFREALIERGFKELFSHGQIFFKYQDIVVNNDEKHPFVVDLFVITHESLINDAESRNNTFLRVLKSAIQKWIVSPTNASELNSSD
jgi:Histidine kinase-, DNA gyrase B-, and HSP90-like ATPase